MQAEGLGMTFLHGEHSCNMPSTCPGSGEGARRPLTSRGEHSLPRAHGGRPSSMTMRPTKARNRANHSQGPLARAQRHAAPCGIPGYVILAGSHLRAPHEDSSTLGGRTHAGKT